MANSFFQFKKFTIHQDACSMKVCTDACVFGAIVATYISDKNITNVLDIGTGTGLLSLMLAQQSAAMIDAVEIDEAACLQANQNFKNSPWPYRLFTYQMAIQHFRPGKKYDCIISNPPFYTNDLLSPNIGRNIALHTTALEIDELFITAKLHLLPNGFFAVLLPFKQLQLYIKTALQYDLHLQQQLLLQHAPGHAWFRAILFFAGTELIPLNNEMAIKDQPGSYTPKFVNLLKDYYLYL